MGSNDLENYFFKIAFKSKSKGKECNDALVGYTLAFFIAFNHKS
jgi:hypothetical protein